MERERAGPGPAEPDKMQALGEPTRRSIIELLCERERSVGELVQRLDLSQPAVSQHLRVLLDARLVDVRRDGRRRLYRPSPEGLRELRDAVERYWTAALSQMKQDLERPAQRRSEADDER